MSSDFLEIILLSSLFLIACISSSDACSIEVASNRCRALYPSEPGVGVVETPFVPTYRHLPERALGSRGVYTPLYQTPKLP